MPPRHSQHQFLIAQVLNLTPVVEQDQNQPIVLLPPPGPVQPPCYLGFWKNLWYSHVWGDQAAPASAFWPIIHHFYHSGSYSTADWPSGDPPTPIKVILLVVHGSLSGKTRLLPPPFHQSPCKWTQECHWKLKTRSSKKNLLILGPS